MKLLVIGGSGFLGRKIVERLISSDYEIFALVRSKDLSPVSGCNYIQLDETNTGQSISDLKFDVIINVAMKRSTRDNIVSE
jgi:nucleoside-diphosphate-sugar epimerase